MVYALVIHQERQISTKDAVQELLADTQNPKKARSKLRNVQATKTPDLMQTCRTIRYEGLMVFYEQKVFCLDVEHHGVSIVRRWLDNIGDFAFHLRRIHIFNDRRVLFRRIPNKKLVHIEQELEWAFCPRLDKADITVFPSTGSIGLVPADGYSAVLERRQGISHSSWVMSRELGKNSERCRYVMRDVRATIIAPSQVGSDVAQTAALRLYPSRKSDSGSFCV